MEKSTERAVANEKSEIFQNLRYERKFIYERILAEDLVSTEVLGNSFCFREIFHRRTVNNMYYDDQSMSFYHQNIAGDEHRDKYRLRWYGDVFSNVEKPTIEIKKKMGVVGDKLSFKLSEFSFDFDKNSHTQLNDLISNYVMQNVNRELSLRLNGLKPSLYNSYERRYFLSDCKKFRITIDHNMCFFNPNFSDYKASVVSFPDVVLEVKYKVEDDKEARKLTQELSSRLFKNSKYVRGVNAVYHRKET